MFNDKSNHIFWNMIKNQKESRMKSNTVHVTSKEKHYSNFLETQSSQLGARGDLMTIIAKLPTYKKICLLQGLLKEAKSIKERFEDNKEAMLEKIKNNCYNYYKSKIGMKEIFDYSSSNYPEIHNDYKLLENPKEALSAYYDTLYKILFLIRDNNDIMVDLIKNCPTNSFEQLSDFIVNFFYENTVDSTFNEEELLIIIYLIIEDFIINKLPKTFSAINNKNHNYINESILCFIFRSITRKADVRSFTCTTLSDTLVKLEGFNEYLTVDTKNLEKKFGNEKKNNVQQNQNNKDEIDIANYRKEGMAEESSSKKRNFSFLGIEIKKNSKKNKLYSTRTIIDNPKIKANSLFSIEEEEINNRLMSIDISNKINLDNIQINNFFYQTDVTLEYLNQVIAEYEKIEKPDCIVNAMKDFIDLQINQISLENNEIYSNYVNNNNIKTYIALNNKENSEKLEKTIIENYQKLTDFMNELLEKINDNITSMPYILKSIYSIIDILIDKKFSNKRVKNLDYQKLMLLSNYLIGNVFLPLVTNPDFNGTITTVVMSKMTKDNLEIVTKIIGKMLSGKLFNNINESEYTIFNKYIIIVLPKIFYIIKSINVQKNFTLSKKIQSLINSVNDINNPKRNIQYDYFLENQENIQQQSICFSWLNLIILIDIIKNCKDLYTNEKYKDYIPDIEIFQNLREYCVNKYNDNIDKREHQFFLLEKIIYNTEFNTKINMILEDNIFALMPKKENDKLSLFKKCLIDVLAYVNILHKENFNYFVQKNQENIIQEIDIIIRLIYEYINKRYIKTEFEGAGKPRIVGPRPLRIEEKQVVVLHGLEENENEDADFKDIIFPQIIDSVKYELSHNLDDDKAKRVVFCSSYLQLHIDDLPQEYKDNNYCLLLMDIMKKGEEIINQLNVSILNQFYLKFKGGEKLNMIITNNYIQVKNMEKCICIEYLFEKLDLPCKLNIKKDGMGVITHVAYEPVDSEKSYVHSIQSFIDIFPNFRKFEDKVDDIIDLEEKVELDVALNAYFKDLKGLIKNQSIVKRFSHEEFETITFELENYILLKLQDKLFPKKSTKTDIKFYKKCCRLDFVKPENLIKDKKMINEKLWKTSIDLIIEMDSKLTPQDKVKNFGKAFGILQNSITFCSGKNELGIDDTITTLIYVILKSKPKNIFSNSKYCQLLLDPELSKKQYGILMSQIEMIKNIINDMKYTDLIGVTEEEFGKDE